MTNQNIEWIIFQKCEVTTVYRQSDIFIIMKNISVNTLIIDFLFVYQQTTKDMLTLYRYILSVVN